MKYILPFFFLLSSLTACAQEVLTLQQALQQALGNNLGIRIARTDEAVRSTDVQIAKGAFLPPLTFIGNTNNFQGNILQQRTGVPEPQQFNNAKSDNINGNFGTNWIFFDGLGMFATRDRMEALHKAGEFNTRLEIDNTVSEVMSGYYELLQNLQQEEVLRQALEISTTRIDIARAKYEVGTGAKIEVLDAQVDLNADKAALIRQQQLVFETKVNLNRLLNRPVGQEFTLKDTILTDTTLSMPALRQQLLQQSPALLTARASQEAAHYATRAVRAEAYPTLGANLTYGYNRQLSDFGFAAQNRSMGINYGLSARFNLFNGGIQRRRVEQARLLEEISSLQVKDQELELDAQLLQTYQVYRNRLSLLRLETDNQRFAAQNAEIALERFRLGILASIVLREAQLNLVQARSRLIQAAYEAKLAEIDLLRLSGSITSVVQ
jgi:outer membrane protein